MNFTDSSSVRYYITTDVKAILGYYCKKAYVFSLSSEGNGGQPDTVGLMTVWFTDQLKGNNLIPGASVTNVNLNGLILEYEIPTLTGLNIVTANSILLNPIADDEFVPNLTGFMNGDTGP